MPAVNSIAPNRKTDNRKAAAEILKYSIIAPHVLRALPEYGSPPLSASEIYRTVNFGCIGTTRYLLSNLAKLGLATAEVVPSKVGGEKKVYTRAASIQPDDFENAILVYGDGE